MSGHLTDEQITALAATIVDDDARQDAILALLQARPITAEDADGILRRCAWAEQRRQRDAARYVPLHEHGCPGIALEHPTPMMDAVDRLPESLRETMTLRYVHDLTVAETAQIQRVSISTIIRRTVRAAKLIRNM